MTRDVHLKFHAKQYGILTKRGWLGRRNKTQLLRNDCTLALAWLSPCKIAARAMLGLCKSQEPKIVEVSISVEGDVYGNKIPT